MSQIITRAILALTLMLSLSWAGKAMAQAGEPAEHEIFMGEVGWEEVGVDSITSPCTGNDIHFDGTVQFTFLVVEVDTPSGMEKLLELQQIHGSAAGLDDQNNAYMANLAASVQFECSADVEGCEMAHVTVRSRTAPNFELTVLIKVNADGTLVVEKGLGTCQATGAVDTGL